SSQVLRNDRTELSSAAGLLAAPAPAFELPAMVEEGRPAPAPSLDKRLGPRRGARVGGARQYLRREPRPPGLGLPSQHLGPIHAGCFGLPVADGHKTSLSPIPHITAPVGSPLII